MKKRLFYLASLTSLALCVSNCGSKKTPASASTAGSGSNTAATAGNNGVNSSDASSTGSGSDATDLSKLPIVYFDYDQASVNDQGRSTLQGIATQLKGKKAKVTVEGHCDERGSNEYNLALGERRSQSVKSYLQKLGIPSDRINSISYGEERPASTGSGESAWAKNRRAELAVSQ